MKRFLVIDCESSIAWHPISFGDMFKDMLCVDDDVFDICRVALGEKLPDINGYNGVILTGSHLNVRDRVNIPWFNSVAQMIQSASIVGFPKIYGGCFGHQIVCHALGGSVDRNPDSKFFLKAEKINIFEALQEYSNSTKHKENMDSIYILKSHGYCVCDLPEDAVVVASSESCRVEAYVAGKHLNILCFQGHPEFEKNYTIHERIWPAVVHQRKALSDEEQKSSLESIHQFTPDNAGYVIDLIRDFLHDKPLLNKCLIKTCKQNRVRDGNCCDFTGIFRFSRAAVRDSHHCCEDNVCNVKYDCCPRDNTEQQAVLLNTRCPWSNHPVCKDSLCIYQSKKYPYSDTSTRFAVGFCNPHCRDEFEVMNKFINDGAGTIEELDPSNSSREKYQKAIDYFDDHLLEYYNREE